MKPESLDTKPAAVPTPVQQDKEATKVNSRRAVDSVPSPVVETLPEGDAINRQRPPEQEVQKFEFQSGNGTEKKVRELHLPRPFPGGVAEKKHDDNSRVVTAKDVSDPQPRVDGATTIDLPQRFQIYDAGETQAPPSRLEDQMPKVRKVGQLPPEDQLCDTGKAEDSKNPLDMADQSDLPRDHTTTAAAAAQPSLEAKTKVIDLPPRIVPLTRQESIASKKSMLRTEVGKRTLASVAQLGTRTAERRNDQPQNGGPKVDQHAPHHQEENGTERMARAAQNFDFESDTAKDGSSSKGTGGENDRSPTDYVSIEGTNGADQIVNPLRSLIAMEEMEIRASRKRKLMCLFQPYDSTRLDELAKIAKVQTISQFLSQRKQPATTAEKKEAPTDLPTAVGLFPHPALAHAAVRPSDKSLKDLEKETLYFHFHPNTERHDRVPSSMRAFSIRFQECSVTTIARWSTMRASGTPAQTENTCRRACVDTNFRKCGVCGNWGHYEKHCAHIQPLEAYRILPASRRISKKPPQRHRPPPPENAENEATVEDCDGFIIEQRAVPRSRVPKETKGTATKNDVLETSVGGIRIRASVSYAGPAAPFKEGDVVAWNMNEQRMLAGTVESVDVGRGLVTARCVRSILLDSANTDCETTDDYLGVLFSLPSKRLRPAKRSGSQASSDDLSKSQKNKRARVLNEDGTVRSKSTPLLLQDGTFKRPRGRKPDGMVWDNVRGLRSPEPAPDA